MKTSLKILVCLALVMVAFGGAYAQFAKSEHAIKYRKSVMFLIAQHFGRMGTVVKGKVAYNKDAFAKNAMAVESLSRMPWEAFMVPGTDKGDTTLNSAAFTQQSQFKQAARTFEARTAKLLSTAQGGDLGAIKPQFGEVAKSCKGCHQQFRTK
jgi:cytochrome c556